MTATNTDLKKFNSSCKEFFKIDFLKPSALLAGFIGKVLFFSLNLLGFGLVTMTTSEFE